MKRNIALILVISLIFSLLVLPASARDKMEVSMSVVPFEEDKANASITTSAPLTEYKAGSLIALKIDFANDSTEKFLCSYGLKINYNSSVLEAYKFRADNRKNVGPQIGSLGGVADYNEPAGSSSFIISEVETSGFLVESDETVTIAYVLFKVQEDVESTAISFDIDLSNNNQIRGKMSEEDLDFTYFEKDIDFSVLHAEAKINGVAPTIGSIAIDPETASSTYASGDEFTLSATSVKGTTITDLVKFKITKGNTDYTQNMGFIVDKGTLKVKSVDPASVGEYTITATSKDKDVCQDPATPVTATFTITKAPITEATVAITGFGKGQAIPAKAAISTDGLAYENIEWHDKDGKVVALGKYAGSSTYTAYVIFHADENHEFKGTADDITVTGVTPTEKVLTSGEGKYSLALTLNTEAKNEYEIFPKPVLEAEYGTLLNNVSFTTDWFSEENKSVATDNKAHRTVDGHFEWVLTDAEKETVKVGNVTEYSFDAGNSFMARFVPDETELYDPVELDAYVVVTKSKIDLSGIQWKLVEDNFTYNCEYHEPALDLSGLTDAQKSLINVTYTGATCEKDVSSETGYTVNVKITAKQPENCEITGFAADGINLTWHINKASLTLSAKEFNAYYQSASVDKTLAELDLSALADEPELNLTFSNLENTESAANVNKVTDANGKITGISIELAATSKVDDVVGVHVTVSSKNYENATFDIRITLEDKAEDKTTMTVSVADITYGETPNPQVTGKPAETSGLTYSYVRTDLGASPKYNEETIQNAPAGKYELTVTCENATKYFIATGTFEIKPRTITKDDVTFGSDLTYTGAPQTQTVIVAINGTTLTAGMDYTADPSGVNGETKTSEDSMSLTAPGTYKVTVKGKGNYAGEVKATFTVGKASLKNATVGDIAAVNYNGTAKTPEPAVFFNEIKLTKGTDYELSYKDNTNVGTATITITAKADSAYFIDSTEKTFEITAIRMDTNSEINVDTIPDQVYNAQPQEPAVTVKFGDKTLVKGTDYTVTYANNTNVSGGTLASATITGIDNFTGEKQATFKINPANLNLSNKNVTHVYTDNVNQTYTVPADMFLAAEKEENKGFTITKTSLTYAITAGKDVLTGNPTVSGNTISYTLKGTPDALGTVAVEVPIHATCGNYNDRTFQLIITVTDKTDVSNYIEFPNGTRTYTGSGIEYKAATLNGNSISATYTYAPAPNSTTASLTDSTDPNGAGLPLTVGTYKVTVNYSTSTSFGSKTATFEIKPATPPTPPEIKVDNTDTTLGELGNKMLVGIGVPGTIHWYGPDGKPITDPDNTKIEANKEYEWTFTPTGNDAKNYFPISGKTTPYIRDDLSWLPGVLGGGSTFNFRDVTRYDYFYSAVKWAAENGIASGTSRYTFSPDAVCTRAQTVTFLWRAAGSPMPSYRISPFTDVNYGDYYYNAVLWAVEQGITTGLTATTFGPDKTVTRGQVAMFLYRAASAVKPNITNPFTDVKSTAYNYDAILWAYDNRITTGTSTMTFSPDAFCTRAQIVTFLYRFYQGR